MPATEQTWRDQKLLHVVFGATSLLMLIATVWMLVQDHRREWKPYQKQFREIETASLNWRINEQRTSDYLQQLTALQDELAAVESVVPPRELVDRFVVEVLNFRARQELPESEEAPWDDAYLQWSDGYATEPTEPLLTQLEERVPDDTGIREAYESWNEAASESEDGQEAAASSSGADRAREELFSLMQRQIATARFREDSLSRRKKFRAADFSVEDSVYGMAVRDGADTQELDEIIEQVAEVKDEVDSIDLELQRAVTYRKTLEEVVALMSAKAEEVRVRLRDHQAELNRLHSSLKERKANLGKRILELPIVDAFGGPLKVDQIWLPDLTIDINFKRIARFDRCVTCHQAMQKTQPGSAVEPAYPAEEVLTLSLPTPEERPEGWSESGEDLETAAATDSPEGTDTDPIAQAYGIVLASRGVLDPDDVVVSAVYPETLGARAQLQAGDVIERIGDARLHDRREAVRRLTQGVTWGEPLALKVRRGMPHPFSTHPRLDLFVGSLSPHKMSEFGCTICHEGQGSATQFKWASHTPNTPLERMEWRREHDWFNNHHWIFPMYPERFVESSCLKCHHNITELEPSSRFPEPPAPKVVQGYHLVRRYGCFGCHEINGYSGPDQRVGPDLRAEPTVHAAAATLLTDAGLTPDERTWATTLTEKPDDMATRNLLKEAVLADSALSQEAGESSARLSSRSHAMAELLKDQETPGTLRKVGPSLRYVSSKVGEKFLNSWLSDPTQFRPDTRMPKFFGLHDHLPSGDIAEKYEPVEIQAITAYLLNKSESFSYADAASSITEAASAERGKPLFETRGCLACHSHQDFPHGQATQGPDLSRIGAKLALEDAEAGQKWLYTWLKNPNTYHARTVMPDTILEPIDHGDGTVTDPAADIAAYLMQSKGWEPLSEEPLSEEVLDELVLSHLTGAFTRRQATQYLSMGIPEEMASQLTGDEVELLGGIDRQKKLNYVGRRAISKYGCFGCHDIPGFEAAKPIGTGLADWGRKEPAKIAFEHILEYLEGKHHASDHASAEGHEVEEHATAEDGHHGLDPLDLGPDEGLFVQALMSHERMGFLWQKLREPRSYDYRKTESKSYHERLRMPKFNFTEEEIEAIMTFVLGLVADPPDEQYVFNPAPRRHAELEGKRVLQKYNCGGCHLIEMDRWQVDYAPDDLFEMEPLPDYAFLTPHFTPQEIAESLETDDRGMVSALLTGRPRLSETTAEPEIVDQDFIPVAEDEMSDFSVEELFHPFTLWKPTVINGDTYQTGDQAPLVRLDRVRNKYPAWGGDLPNWIYPRVLEKEREFNPAASADEAWGWLPPPLVGEGSKVQPQWLHDFLLDPHLIRPSVILRMPKFNMSSAEAAKVANYFAAVDGEKYPYEFNSRSRGGRLADLEAAHPNRLSDAMKIVTDNNYCIKCHALGDFDPQGQRTAFGTDKAAAPNLAHVAERLRPDFTLHWVANPKRFLPYTGMPVNIPADRPVDQKLYTGDSLEQLNGVIDLLMNFEVYLQEKTPLSPLVKAAPTTDASAGGE